MINRLALFSMATVALMMVSGCLSLGRMNVEKRLYSLEARMDTPGRSPEPQLSIMVKEFEIAPMYTTNSFVYRMEEFRFETDYYNEFIIPPQRMISEAFKQALFDTRRYSASTPDAPAAYRLSGKVIRLYGDFSTAGHPLAMMEISILLEATAKADLKPSVSKNFIREIPINDPAPAPLIRGWNTLLKEIINAFMDELDRVTP